MSGKICRFKSRLKRWYSTAESRNRNRRNESESDGEFQTIGPATENAWELNVLRQNCLDCNLTALLGVHNVLQSCKNKLGLQMAMW